ncbi:flagellar biosynthetic protein FliO [Peteryoungia ipomoeae]|uniref:Flagellar biosynthesis protein FliO n=1 Tax=Peteryoungia ipomoeae TaxID=1210932 RepID=A0A4S8PA98_9HYPH|nr:flagellar biosynthetic protein FliO [Peteryoungia ipomoeae]THV24974.1 hypothetical protein FAA97_01840 [Peteryoungia ipomoeae]
MVDELMSAYGDNFLVAALGVALGLLCLFIVLWLLRSRAPSPFVRGGRNRQPRLQILDAAAVDTRRRIVLIRRDNVEHLVMIGGPTDIVIETGIGDERIPTANTAPAIVQNAAEPPSVAVEALDNTAALALSAPPASPAARATPPSTPAPNMQQPLRVAPAAPPVPPAPMPTASLDRRPDAPSRPQSPAAAAPVRPDAQPPEKPIAPQVAQVAPVTHHRSEAPPPAQAPSAPPVPVVAPTIAAERRPDQPAPTAKATASARSEPTLFAAATFASTLSASAVSAAEPDDNLRSSAVDNLVPERDALPESDAITTSPASAKLSEDHNRQELTSIDIPKRLEPVVPIVSVAPSIDEDLVKISHPAESWPAPSEPAAAASQDASLKTDEPTVVPSLDDSSAETAQASRLSGLDQIFGLDPVERNRTTEQDAVIDPQIPEPTIADSVMELQPELTEIDDIYVPNEEPRTGSDSIAVRDDEPQNSQQNESPAAEHASVDLPDVEEILDVARHKVLVDGPEPRPFPQERFDRTPEPVHLEPTEPPKRDMSDFERVLEQEMAMHLAASPIPAKRDADDDNQYASMHGSTSESPRLPADILLGDGLVARRPTSQPDGAKAETDPNLQNEIARIFGEMSASRNS